MRTTGATGGNAALAAAVERVHERVRAGAGFAGPLGETGFFPDMVTGMVAVGEETGALAEMLVRVADAYDEEVDSAAAGLTSLIEPALIVVLAVVVGTVVLALFLPVVRILQVMS